jgi:hypothetical protein
MPRPHEDLEHHTTVDHRPGGDPIQFKVSAWYAIDMVHLAADRVDAGIAAYETLVEKARGSSAHVRSAVIFRSTNNRRVIAVAELSGHDAFRHLKSAWDDHHLSAEHRAVAESGSLALYRMIAILGRPLDDAPSKDTYAFELVARPPQAVRALGGLVERALGFLGAVVFGTDDDRASAILYRFEHAEEFEAFRGGKSASEILGIADVAGDILYTVHPVKAFA